MNIALCIDNNYAQHCGVLITSICENNINEIITFHIIYDSISASNILKLKNIISHYNKTIIFHEIDRNLLSYCPERGYYTVATYYRILLPDMLPSNISKILYLDSDIVVCGKLNDLWNTNIDNYSCGAVIDCQALNTPSIFKRLGYSSELKYFNAGVLLINIDYWRKNNIKSRTLDFIKTEPEKIQIVDQDALNYILKGTCLFISIKYNLMDQYIQKNMWDESINENDRNNAIENPLIIHYSIDKPWNYICRNPYKNEYYKYLHFTEWKYYKPQKNFVGYIKFHLKKILFTLHIKQGIEYRI